MKKKIIRTKHILFMIVLLIIYIYTLNLLNKINLNIENDNFYKFLIKNSSSISTEITYKTFKNLINFKPNKLLTHNLKYIEEKKDENELLTETLQEEIKEEVKEKPETIIYIYNTHQTENYSNDYLADYTITPNIMIASYMLKENLEEYGIYSYVEENSVKEILNKNNWNYASSYRVTRQFIEKRVTEIPTLKYYIDLHRDSVKKKHTTVEINGINYAKVMLLVGLEHNNYQQNLKEATKMNNIINELYPGLSRGIYKKSGKGVNGIYNQDFSKYVFLFEIGGVDNNISEVNNTITALAKVIKKYLDEEGAETY